MLQNKDIFMLKLHHAPNSRAGRIVWLLEELKLPYDINTMKFHPSDLKSDEHEPDTLLEEIPVLEDNDISIYESGAIVEYILARHAQESSNLTLMIILIRNIYNGFIIVKVWLCHL